MIGGLTPKPDLAMAYWPSPSGSFWEVGQLLLLKIEWGPGDKYN